MGTVKFLLKGYLNQGYRKYLLRKNWYLNIYAVNRSFNYIKNSTKMYLSKDFTVAMECKEM